MWCWRDPFKRSGKVLLLGFKIFILMEISESENRTLFLLSVANDFLTPSQEAPGMKSKHHVQKYAR